MQQGQPSHMKSSVQKPVSINISFSVNQKSIVKQTHASVPPRPKQSKRRKSVSDQVQVLNFQNVVDNDASKEKQYNRSRDKKHSQKKMHSNSNDQSLSFKNPPSKESDPALSDRYVSKDMALDQDRKNKLQIPNLGLKAIHKRKRKQNSMDLYKEQSGNTQSKPSDHQKSIKLHSKSHYPQMYQQPAIPHKQQRFHKYSHSQNLRKKSKGGYTQNESSRSKCIYSNSLIRTVLENPTERKKNNSLKNFINQLVKKQLSKRTLYEEYNKQHTKRKSKQRVAVPVHKKGGSKKVFEREKQYQKNVYDLKQTEKEAEQSSNYQDAFQEFVNRLSSLKSMDSSVLKSQVPEEVQLGVYDVKKLQNNSQISSHSHRYVETQQSSLLIKEIHEFQKLKLTSKSRKSHQAQEQLNSDEKGGYTLDIINTYIALLNQNGDQPFQHGELLFHEPKQKTHVQHSDFGNFFDKDNEENFSQGADQKNADILDLANESPIATKVDDTFRHQIADEKKEIQIKKQKSNQKDAQSENIVIPQIGLLQQSESKYYNPSELEKQKIQSQNPQEKIPQQEIEKWKEMVSYMMANVNSQASKKQILGALNQFLGSSNAHLGQILTGKQIIQQLVLQESEVIYKSSNQKLLNQPPNNLKPGDFEDEQEEQQQDPQSYGKLDRYKEHIPSLDRQFSPSSDDGFNDSSEDDIESIMSGEQPNLVNLTTIDKILKNRYNELMDRKTRDILRIEEKWETGKLTHEEMLSQRKKIDKWIKNQTKHIMKAKKNIWRGYNEVKGIMGKSERNNEFQGISRVQNKSPGKRNKMMKCLSDKYIGKKSHLLNKESDEEEQDNLFETAKDQFKKKQKPKEDDNQVRQDEKNYDEQMSKIKERLLKMKQNHLQRQDDQDVSEYEDSPDKQNQQQSVSVSSQKDSPDLSPAISYEQVDKQFPAGHNSSSDAACSNNNITDPDNVLVSQSQMTEEESTAQSNQRKLKYLCQQDKEDIFEFIFLDLCIELYQEPCYENKIMKGVNGHLNKAKKQAKKNKGVRTNLNIVKEYLKRFQAFIHRAHKQTLENLNTPMGPTAYEMLKYMRDSDDVGDPGEEQTTVAVVVPVDLFDKFEKSLLSAIQFDPYFDDQEREEQRVQFLKNVLHIHNKAIFDALNQSLDHERPFGLWGVPFPWKKCPTKIRTFTEDKIENKFKKCCDNVSQYCAYVCGLLTDKQESLVGNAHLSEEYLMSIRQDRLSRMLANDLIENQERWLFFDDQQAQVLVQSGRYVMSKLLGQICQQFAMIKKKRQGWLNDPEIEG